VLRTLIKWFRRNAQNSQPHVLKDREEQVRRRVSGLSYAASNERSVRQVRIAEGAQRARSGALFAAQPL
jgi:hypothetical protein